MARDWLTSLWPASFKGAAFYVERDRIDGGKRVVTHQFPGRDLPFNEELGDEARTYEVHAYFIGDACDAQADALLVALESAGTGVLVLPDQGPVTVMATKPFRRERLRDKLGVVTIEAHFVIDGGAAALISVNSLAALAFDAISALGAASAVYAATAPLIGRPNWAAAETAAALQNIPAALETILSSAGANPGQIPAILADLQASYLALGADTTPLTGVSSSDVAGVFIAVAAVAAATPGAAGSSAFASAVGYFPPPAAPAIQTPNARAALAGTDIAARTGRLAMLAGYAAGLIETTFGDRPSAAAARNAAMRVFDGALTDAGTLGSHGVELYRALAALRDAVVNTFAVEILNLQPVVSIEAPFEAPALYWAWRLYADPTRASEIVARNLIAHPAFVPRRFEALAA